jgi:flavin-dependent dehydrogenase
LVGGERALTSLYPGFDDELTAAGAIPGRVGYDLLFEHPLLGAMPRRDTGMRGFLVSRPLVEHVLRARVRALPNVQFVAASAMSLNTDQGRVTGLQLKREDGKSETLDAELVVDASGRGELTLAALQALRLPAPEVTTIGVDIAYSTAQFELPAKRPDWRGVMTLPLAPRDSRGGLMIEVEGGRWILSVGGVGGGDHPPGDWESFMAFVRGLRTTTIADAIASAKPIGEIQRYGFPESRRRHFERLQSFPQGLLPIGDALCRFNPIYGQGMSVAALQAAALAQLLQSTPTAQRASLAMPFFARAAEIIDGPWQMSALPDFVYPQTKGERPPDFETFLQLGAALDRLAFQDAEVFTLMQEVRQLVTPRTALMTPPMVQKIMAVMAQAPAASAP